MILIHRCMAVTVLLISTLQVAAAGGLLPDRLERIDEAINASIANGEIPGAVALVVSDGKVAYHEAFGFADVASQRPMRKDTIFRIASMTKAITTVAVMILYEEGHFQLNDPLSEFLPEFANMRVATAVGDHGLVTETVPAAAPIRIIDLLTHTSGLSYPFIPSRIQKTYVSAGVIDGPTASDILLADQVELLARQPLLTHPGTAFTYGLSSDVAGRLVEVVSGQSFAEFVAARITEPLGMPDTAFYLSSAQADRLATLYAYVENRGLVVSDGTEADIKLDNPNFAFEGSRSNYSGGAGMSSTVLDYARLCRMLLRNGEFNGVRILSRKAVELMRTPRVDMDGDETPDFGLGFQVVSDIGRTGELGSNGAYRWGGAFYTSYWIDPAEDLVGIFMSQVRPSQADIDTVFKTLVYQALE